MTSTSVQTPSLLVDDRFVLIGTLALASHLLLFRLVDLWPEQIAKLYVGLFALDLTVRYTYLHSGIVGTLFATVVDVVTYTVFVLASIGVYRLKFHRIADIPGPTSWALSKWSTFGIDRQGLRPRAVHAAHVEYGDVVRTGPCEVSINSPYAVAAISAAKSECWKGPWYDSAAGGREPHIMRSLINLTDRTEHQRRRKTWDAAFSAKALKGYEGALVNNMEIMLRQLAKRANADEAVDIDDWGMFFAFDMISEVGFGRNLGLLEQGKLSPILEQLEDLMKFQQVVNNRPYMIEVTRQIPTPKGAYAGMVMELLEQRDKDAHGQKADIMQFLYEASAEEEGTDESDSTTFDKYNMRNNRGRRAELAAEARLIIVAGSDTSSTVMAMTLFLLLQHPKVTTQLRAELDRVFGTDYETVLSDFTRLDRECPLLNAVINESMRLFPPLAGGLQKVNTRGSTIVPLASGSKMVVPKDVVMTIPTWTMQRDARNFSPEPNAFRPERWLHPESEERFDRRAFVPFSAGATVCVGKLLAYMELRLVIANLVRRFDMTATSDFDPVAFEDGLRDVFVSTRLKKLSVKLTDRSSGASQAAAAV